MKRWLIYTCNFSMLTALCVVTVGCQSPGKTGALGRQHSGVLFGHQGAPWSILCLEMTGDYRKAQMEQIADTLHQTKGIRGRDIIVQDGSDDMSRLYYGKYYRKTNAETGRRSVPKQMAADLMFLRSLTDSQGKYFFLRARKVRFPTPDVGLTAWDLREASGAYTLQVGVFEPTDDFVEFKQAAAEFCKLLRDRGFEAYYYHTESGSTVSVGSFGEDAVIAQPRGLPRYSREVLALQHSDDLMKYNRLNGAVYNAKTDRGKKIPVASRLVRIPQMGEGW